MLALRLPHEALEPLHAQRFGEAFGQRVAVLLCELERRVSDRLGVLAVLEQGHVHLLVCRPHLLPQPRAVAVQQVRAQLRDELCVVDPGLAPHVRDGPASHVEADGRGDRCVEVLFLVVRGHPETRPYSPASSSYCTVGIPRPTDRVDQPAIFTPFPIRHLNR